MVNAVWRSIGADDSCSARGIQWPTLQPCGRRRRPAPAAGTAHPAGHARCDRRAAARGGAPSPTCCGRAARRRSRPTRRRCRSSVGGVTFNVPPAAIRVPVQRQPGAQARIDLTFLWPSLTPPDPAIKPPPTDAPNVERPALRHHRGERRHAAADRAPEDDLSALSRRRAGRRRRRAQHARCFATARLSGRGPDLRSAARPSASCSAARGRTGRTPRHVPARAAHRQCRRHGALSARLARGLARGRRGIDRLIAGFARAAASLRLLEATTASRSTSRIGISKM